MTSKAEMSHFNSLPDKTNGPVFKAPDGYFDQLPSRISDRIHLKVETFEWTSFIKPFGWSLGIVGLLILAILSLENPSVRESHAELSTEELDADQITDAALQTSFGSDLVCEYYLTNIPAEEDALTIETVSMDETIEYLQEQSAVEQFIDEI